MGFYARKAILLLLLFGLFPLAAYAWPPTYGAEFEFTNDALNATKNNSKPTELEFAAARRMVEVVRKKCVREKCKVIDAVGKWGKGYAARVELENGFWFFIDTDPSCVEIQTKPSTLRQLKKLQPLLDKLIFKSAKQASLAADFATGAGHFNIGVHSAFGDDPERFLQYFVDSANYPEFASETMDYDFSNAPPLSSLSAKQRAALSQIIRETKEGKYKTTFALAKALRDRVYPKSFYENVPGFHNQALSIEKLQGDPLGKGDADVPMEHRAVPPQTSMEDFILRGELFEKRAKFLASENAPPLHYINTSRRVFDAEEAVGSFYIYVVEAGGDFDRYSQLMRPYYRDFQPGIFLTGGPAWSDPEYAPLMKKYLRLLPTSKFLRNKFLAALKDPGAFSPGGIEVMQRLQSYLRKSTNEVEIDAYRGLLQEALASEPWQSNWHRLPADLRDILGGKVSILEDCQTFFSNLKQ